MGTQLGQHPHEGLLPRHLADELDLSRGEVDVAGQHIQPVDGGGRDHVQRIGSAGQEEVVDRDVQGVGVDAQPHREGPLRVEVHQQHLAAQLGECRAQVDGGGGLAHPTLLVAHRHNGGVLPAGGHGGRVRKDGQRAARRPDATWVDGRRRRREAAHPDGGFLEQPVFRHLSASSSHVRSRLVPRAAQGRRAVACRHPIGPAVRHGRFSGRADGPRRAPPSGARWSPSCRSAWWRPTRDPTVPAPRAGPRHRRAGGWRTNAAASEATRQW